MGAIVLFSILAGGAAGARPLAEPIAVAAGGRFVTAEIVLPEGSTLSLANLDAAAHSLTSLARRANGERVFDSGLVGFGRSGRVAGVEELGANADGYAFVCLLHPLMRGTIRVLPSARQ